MIDPTNRSLITLKKLYLITAFGLIFMVVLGGYTRLTGSGLSIVNWDLYRDLFPPMSHSAWMQVFDAYKTSPEFKLTNSWMGLGDFKRIFWLEYVHRLLGRILGALFLVPLLLTFIKPCLKGYRLRTFSLFLLGALQGAMGWYMVKSGLVKDPHVSHFRLAAHLLIAFITGACLIWSAMQIGNRIRTKLPHNTTPPKFLNALLGAKGVWLMVLILMTITYGAFVAGLKAGLLYNEFPLMGGHLIPTDLIENEPQTGVLENFFINPVAVQWMHRMLALVTLVYGLIWAYKTKKKLHHMHAENVDDHLRAQEKALKYFVLFMCLQVLLGIATILYYVPLNVAVVHQLNAFFLIIAGLRVLFVLDPHYVACRDENLLHPE